MKICFIAPGLVSVPPQGHGALELVVWNQSEQLKALGHEIRVVNEPTIEKTYDSIETFSPDIIHLHYGKYYELLAHFPECRRLVTNHDGSFCHSLGFHEMVIRKYLYDCEFFSLTKFEKEFLIKLGISPNKIKILPNGVNTSLFKQDTTSAVYDGSICLGKIDNRKRQPFLQKLDLGIDFVGEIATPEFNSNDRNYRGIWSREDVCAKLCRYSNLILLSESELQALVILEAFSAGLGVVISEACTENLDLTKKFISVIPADKMSDREYLRRTIKENAQYSVNNRHLIVNYAKEFDWKNIAIQYNNYLKNENTRTNILR